MPDPKLLYENMRNLLKIFETLKELISSELLKIEVFVKRGKAYLKEDNDLIRRNLEKMIVYLKKMKNAKDRSIKDDYSRQFYAMNAKTQEVVAQYKKLKQWLITTLNYFSQLFYY